MGIPMGIPTGENLIPIPMGMGIPMGIPIPTATLYNTQKAAEVAILMANEPTANRDIVIRLKDGHLKRI